MKFWNASAIVPLCLREPATPRLRRVAEDGALVAREVRESAGRVLLLHPLRAADSLQLAAALLWARSRPAGHDFVCLDERLREAASREGFVVFP